MKSPVTGRITSCYKNPKRPSHHRIDFGIQTGSDIVASAPGTVVKVGINETFGNMVVIQHEPTNGMWTYTVYAHLSTYAAGIITGTSVNEGQLLGLSGGQPGTPGAGRSTGSHLHLK